MTRLKPAVSWQDEGNDSTAAAATSSSREHEPEEEPAMAVTIASDIEEGVRISIVRLALFNRSVAWSVSVHWH